MESIIQITTDQWNYLVKVLKCAYTSPNFLPDPDAVRIWYQAIKDLPYDVLNIAIMKYIQSNKFPPTPADLRECSAEITTVPDGGWDEAWEEVMAAQKYYGFMYRYEEAMASLSEIAQLCVKRIGWEAICLDKDVTATRANFRMIYEQITQRNKSKAVLSANLLKQIDKKRIELEERKQALIEEVTHHEEN